MDSSNRIASAFPSPRPGVSELTALDADIVELALLLPRWQASALENVAYSRGITVGQMLRKLITSTLAASPLPVG